MGLGTGVRGYLPQDGLDLLIDTTDYSTVEYTDIGQIPFDAPIDGSNLQVDKVHEQIQGFELNPDPDPGRMSFNHPGLQETNDYPSISSGNDQLITGLLGDSDYAHPANPTVMIIVNLRGEDAGANLSYMIGSRLLANPWVFEYITEGKTSPYGMQLFVPGQGVIGAWELTSGSFDDSRTHCLIFTKDASHVFTLYFDGTPVLVFPGAALPVAQKPIIIGKRAGDTTPSRPMDFMVYAVWDRPLTLFEVQDMVKGLDYVFDFGVDG